MLIHDQPWSTLPHYGGPGKPREHSFLLLFLMPAVYLASVPLGKPLVPWNSDVTVIEGAVF